LLERSSYPFEDVYGVLPMKGMQMKILFLEQFSEMGGGQRNLVDLLPAICARGWQAVVAAPGEGPLFDAAREAGADVERIALGQYANGKKTTRDAIRFVSDTARLQHWIARHDSDLISVGGPRMLVAAALSARRRPVIFQAQHFFLEPRVLDVAGWAIRYSKAKVVANSKYVAKQFERHANAQIVYNGVKEIPFMRREFGPRWRIGVIGRIAPMKGQTDFLRAAAEIAPRLPGARFVICGAPIFCPASYVQEVDRLAAALPVDFLGWREDVHEVLQELDLLVVPSTKAEATTRVILEAFSAGVPVVGYAVGGIPEIVRDGQNGFLVPECEAGALARKIIEITKSDLTAVVRTARADWEKSYSVLRYREQMAGVMSKCVQDRSRAIAV
jgi:glycosyltransferase involved in cell wall biosynthesis